MSSVSNNITTYTPASTTNAAGNASANGSTLNEQTFLNLLTTQLQNQDPLDPMSDEDFMGQMAQFSSLQQMQTLNTNFSGQSTTTQLSSGATMIGHTVTTSTNDSSGNPISGVVSAVTMTNGNLQLTIGNNSAPMSSVTQITN